MLTLFNRLLEYINAAKIRDNNYTIAVYIAKHFKEVSTMNIDQLANACFVSQATISRFCRFMGYSSYAEYRKSLFNSIEGIYKFAIEEQHLIDLNEDLEDSYSNYLDDVIDTVNGLKQLVDFKQIDSILKRIHDTKKVMLFGYKHSALIASHLQSGLMYSYKYLDYYSDTYEQLVRIKELNKGDLAIIVTVEGRYLHTIHPHIAEAKKRGVYVICITHNNSTKIKDMFNEVLLVGNNQSPIGGRYAAHCMVDILVSRYLYLYNEKK